MLRTYPDFSSLSGNRRKAASRPVQATPSSVRLARFVALALQWLERSRSRRALATLDDRLLRDVGLTRADVWRECAKPFWVR